VPGPGPRPQPGPRPVVQQPRPQPILRPQVGIPQPGPIGFPWMPPPQPGLTPMVRIPDSPPVVTVMRPPDLPALRGVEKNPGRLPVPLTTLPDLAFQSPNKKIDTPSMLPRMDKMVGQDFAPPQLPVLEGKSVMVQPALPEQSSDLSSSRSDREVVTTRLTTIR